MSPWIFEIDFIIQNYASFILSLFFLNEIDIARNILIRNMVFNGSKVFIHKRRPKQNIIALFKIK